MSTVDLMRFAGKSDPREYMRQPIPYPGGAYTTNGHVMVFLAGATAEAVTLPAKMEAVANEYRQKALDCAGPWTAATALPLVGDRQCWECEGRGRIRSHICDECDAGTFVHGSHTYTCMECDGEGDIVEPADTGGDECGLCGGCGIQPEPVQIGDVTNVGLSTKYLYQLRELPDCELSWADNVIAFRFTGGFGVVMPMTGMRKRA
jgi:hypothetical protein